MRMALNKDCNKPTIADIDQTNQVNLVVRIDDDSDTNLQALFDSVLKPGDSKMPLQVPFRMRKLPNSFFNPPVTGSKSPTVSHSRANSTDSAFSTDSQTNACTDNQNVPHNPAIVATSGLTISHSRAHSSPASLQQSYAGLNTQPSNQAATGTIAKSNCNPNATPQNQSENSIQRIHMKQRSYDVISPIQLQNELGALPPGWEQAKTNDGQIYYLNHITKTTQWEDPRIPIQRQQQQLIQRSVNPRTVSKDSAVSSDSLGPLPEGWEQALTESGDVYFINHINRTTSWNDPRIPIYMQKSSSVSRSEMNWMESKNLEKERDFLKARETLQEHRRLVHKIDLQMDPFLSGIADHSRQESADSGLSLSSNNFSVTPDYLSQIGDSMDCISENGDLASVSGLESPDNLVSSLQLNDNLCNEMLSDVQSLVNPVSTKQDDIDWYKIN